MMGYCEEYASAVWTLYQESLKTTPDAELILEARVDFSKYVPDGTGSADVQIIADGTLTIVDLKYGKGTPVNAVDNPQLRLYAIGAVLEALTLYDIERVSMHIVQPRNEIGHTSEDMTVADLFKWAEEVVVPAAKLADAGEGTLCAGDHCKFCEAKTRCPEWKSLNDRMVAAMFEDDSKKGEGLSLEDLADVLKTAKALTDWLKAVQETALTLLMEGEDVPGYKVVEGRSSRKYADPDGVLQHLVDAGYSEAEVCKPRELITLTAMEKFLGKKKFAELIGDLVEKPEGAPTLAPESDKRPDFRKKKAEDLATMFASDSGEA